MQNKNCVIVLFFMFGLLIPTYSQDEGGGANQEEQLPPEQMQRLFLYSSGDQTIGINLGVIFPLFFTEGGKNIGNNVSIGGSGSIIYTHFLSPHLFVGGEIGGMFAATKGENMLYIVPVTAYIGSQFIFNRFEIPLSFAVGVASQTHITNEYAGFFFKPKASVFFRINPEWSLGLNAGWWIVPQWFTNTGRDVVGHFFELTLGVRHHF